MAGDSSRVSRKALAGVVSVYILFFFAFWALGSNILIGIKPLVWGWIPAWLAGTYALSIVFLVFTAWVMDRFSAEVVGEQTEPLFGHLISRRSIEDSRGGVEQ